MTTEITIAMFPVLTFVLFIVLSILALVIFFIVFWLWMLVDCLSSELDVTNKLFWVIIMLAFNFIGALAYLIIAKKRKKVIVMKKKTSKRLFRSKSNRIIAGVCGGVGEYFGIDPTVVRLLWVLFTFLGGSGILAYIICWIVIPEEK